MAGSRSKMSDPSYYGNGNDINGKARKVDVVADKGSQAACLKERRKWVESGMEGPNPYSSCMKGK